MTKPTNGPDLKKRYFGLTFLLLFSPLFFLPVSSGTSEIPHLDKVIHLIFHFSIVCWFIFAKERLLVAACISAFYGTAIELLQSLTATRSFELLDIAANLLGMLIAVYLGKIVRNRFGLERRN